MSTPRRLAITGAGGRLGRAMLETVAEQRDVIAVPWRRPEYDLDGSDPVALIQRDAPDVVIHAAAWTDVDGCARDPQLALRRNATAVGLLAEACMAHGVGLVVVSTNEVFDGRRADGCGYAEADATGPLNPYGASKLAGEQAAHAAFGDEPGLWIVRTAWLYGPPGNDFPNKIIAASDRRGDDEPLPVVADEIGSPTSTGDLAAGIVQLISATDGGTFHLVNRGAVSRFDWARSVLERVRPGRSVRPIQQAELARDSTPPAWAVLDTAAATAAGVRMRAWDSALTDYLAALG